jgi:hypothetical protein
VKTLTGSQHGLFATLGHHGVISIVASLLARVGTDPGDHLLETLGLGRLTAHLVGTIQTAGRCRQDQDCSLFRHRASIAPVGAAPTSVWHLISPQFEADDTSLTRPARSATTQSAVT